MKRRTTKNILFVFITVVVIASVAGYLLWNKPHANILEAKAIEINAIILYKTFITDSGRAKAIYVNKVLNVSGIVKSISVNQQQQQIILLKTTEPAASINCTMEKNVQELKAGDEVSLKGMCVGYIAGDAEMGLPGDVFMIRCYHSI